MDRGQRAYAGCAEAAAEELGDQRATHAVCRGPTQDRALARLGGRAVTVTPRVKGKRAGVSTDLVMTLEDAASKLGIGLTTAYEAAKAGTLPTIRFGRRWLVPRAQFERMLNGDTKAGDQP